MSKGCEHVLLTSTHPEGGGGVIKEWKCSKLKYDGDKNKQLKGICNEWQVVFPTAEICKSDCWFRTSLSTSGNGGEAEAPCNILKKYIQYINMST